MNTLLYVTTRTAAVRAEVGVERRGHARRVLRVRRVNASYAKERE
jgi:hypothetical protein